MHTIGYAATGDGIATMNVTATTATPSVVIASLSNGASLQAHFTGGTSPVITAKKRGEPVVVPGLAAWGCLGHTKTPWLTIPAATSKPRA